MQNANKKLKTCLRAWIYFILKAKPDLLWGRLITVVLTRLANSSISLGKEENCSWRIKMISDIKSTTWIEQHIRMRRCTEKQERIFSKRVLRWASSGVSDIFNCVMVGYGKFISSDAQASLSFFIDMTSCHWTSSLAIARLPTDVSLLLPTSYTNICIALNMSWRSIMHQQEKIVGFCQRSRILQITNHSACKLRYNSHVCKYLKLAITGCVKSFRNLKKYFNSL